jgi:hypothetical protein
MLPSRPLVSVWMITYNHALFLREALDSVLMQQANFPLEICLGEDGSSDGTREICLEYARKRPDVFRLFLRNRSNPRRGGYKAPFMYNVVETLRACRGKYIAMLEGDDFWTSPAKLRKQVAVLEGDSRLSVCGHYVQEMVDGRPWEGEIVPAVRSREFTLQTLLEQHVVLPLSSVMLRGLGAADLDRFRPYPVGDLFLEAMYLARGDGVVLPEVLSTYRRSAAGAWSSLSTRNVIMQSLAILEELRGIVPPEHMTAYWRGYARCLASWGSTLRRSGSQRQALRCLGQLASIVRNHLHGAPVGERVGLLINGVEAVGAPRLRRMRERVFRRVSQRWGSAAAGVP